MKINSERGNAALLILVILGAVGVSIETYRVHLLKESSISIANARAKWGRTSIANRIEQAASQPIVFRSSLRHTENKDLQNCVLGNAGNACRADGTEYPLTLYSMAATGNESQAFTGAGPESSNAVPVLYDMNGIVCAVPGLTAATPQCPFEVTTTFTAKCPGAAASCAKAESLSVRYVIKIPEAIKANSALVGRVALAAIDKFSVDIATSDIIPIPSSKVLNNIRIAKLVPSGDVNLPEFLSPDLLSTPEQALAMIKKSLGDGADPDLADELFESFYKDRKISDLRLIEQFTKDYVIHPGATMGMVDRISWYIHDYPKWNTEKIPMTTVLSEIDKSFAATSWLPKDDGGIAYRATNSGFLTRESVENYVDSLNGNRKDPIMYALAEVKIPERTRTDNIITAIEQSGAGNNDYTVPSMVAYAAKDYPDISLKDLSAFARTIVAANIESWDVAWNILNNRITDVSIAKQMQRDEVQHTYVENVVVVNDLTTVAANGGSGANDKIDGVAVCTTNCSGVGL